MSTQTDTVEVVDGEIVDSLAIVPYSGEPVALRDAPTEQLARVLDETREFEQVTLRAFKRDVQAEVLRRMDANAEWTIHAEGGYKLAGDSPSRTEFDVGELKAALERLVEDGELTAEAAAKAIRIKMVEEVSVSGLKALRKLGGRVAEAIDAVERPASKPRGVRVTRGTGR